MQEILLKIRYFDRGLSKSLKKANFIFFSNLVLFNGPNYQKQKGPETSDQSIFKLGNKFRKIPLLVMHYLTKFMMKYKAVFELLQKLHLQIYAGQLMAS